MKKRIIAFLLVLTMVIGSVGEFAPDRIGYALANDENQTESQKTASGDSSDESPVLPGPPAFDPAGGSDIPVAPMTPAADPDRDC